MSDWIEWNGGECPVPAGVEVFVKFGNDPNGEYLPSIGSRLRWDWIADGNRGDITAYRIHHEPCKPEPETDPCLLLHELLDRVSCLQSSFESHIAEHLASDQFRKRISGISKRLGKLYQEIGAVRFKEES